MTIVREYALQSIFAVLHSAVIVGGSMFTATIMKVRGYAPENAADWHWQLVFVRNWGFTLILIPAAWVIATLWLERHQAEWFSKRWTIVSGIVLLCGLAFFLARTTVRAGSSIISIKEDASAHERD